MSRILERGDVFFFYRPRVGIEQVRGLDDVQRFTFILQPDTASRFRRLLVGRKRLPSAREHERAWAFVAEVSDVPDDLRDDIEPKIYETATRGLRFQPGARPVGEARYALVDHDGHTHFSYLLELPREPGPAQRIFNISAEASHIVAVRNPEAPAPPGAGLGPRQRAQLPPELAERFGGRRFSPLDPPDFLDYVGVEIVLIGAYEDADAELGIELDAEDERLETAEIFRELQLRPGEIPIEPLYGGELR